MKKTLNNASKNIDWFQILKTITYIRNKILKDFIDICKICDMYYIFSLPRPRPEPRDKTLNEIGMLALH